LTGLVSFFGSVNVGIPLLLDLMRIPVDPFQLYLAITVVSSRSAVLVTTMNNTDATTQQLGRQTSKRGCYLPEIALVGSTLRDGAVN
jgi:hypothetical protein